MVILFLLLAAPGLENKLNQNAISIPHQAEEKFNARVQLASMQIKQVA